jgi:hypothetical protein
MNSLAIVSTARMHGAAKPVRVGSPTDFAGACAKRLLCF